MTTPNYIDDIMRRIQEGVNEAMIDAQCGQLPQEILEDLCTHIVVNLSKRNVVIVEKKRYDDLVSNASLSLRRIKREMLP